MAVTNYYSVGGEIIGEKTVGSNRVDYLTDALGSVTATLNQSAQVVNTYRYKPYGTQLAKTGTGADPSFGWVGSQGYRPTIKKFADVYVRARHYSTSVNLWTSVDPLWPEQAMYLYVASNPTNYVDPSGMDFVSPDPHCSCNPTMSHPKSDCYQSACARYCHTIDDALGKSATDCFTIPQCWKSNQQHGPCTSSNPYWSICGPSICRTPGDPTCANKSNWPAPEFQIDPRWCFTIVVIPFFCGDAGGEFCCVECMMRSCCSQLTYTNPLLRLRNDLNDCDKKNKQRK